MASTCTETVTSTCIAGPRNHIISKVFDFLAREPSLPGESGNLRPGPGLEKTITFIEGNEHFLKGESRRQSLPLSHWEPGCPKKVKNLTNDMISFVKCLLIQKPTP